MHKLISMAVLMGISTLTMANAITPSPFQGFHAGANISYIVGSNTNTYDTYINLAQPEDSFLVNTSYSQANIATTMGGGASFGYNFQLGSRVILGLETRLLAPQSYQSNTNRNLTVILPEGIIPLAPTVSSISIDSDATSRLDIGSTLDFLLKTGYLVTPNSMIYGIAGIGLTKTTMSISTMFSARSLPSINLGDLNTNTSMRPLIVGAGYEQFLASNVSLNLELNETFYPKVTVNRSFSTPDISDFKLSINTIASIKAITTFAANLGINYYF
jgi:opacity protein-like surface antigen